MGNRIKIDLGYIEKIKEFVRICERYEEDIVLYSHRYEVNAKSIMGVFSLNLGKPIEVEIISDDETVCKRFECDMKEYEAIS